VEALPEAAAEALQLLGLGLVLDALGDLEADHSSSAERTPQAGRSACEVLRQPERRLEAAQPVSASTSGATDQV
jgi:hypothetical protein